MTQGPSPEFKDSQIVALEKIIHRGVAEASRALSQWLHAPSSIVLDSLQLLPLHQATDVLGASDQLVCFCAMGMTGLLQGQLVLVFDDESGLALADLALSRTTTDQRSWGEIETSAALETANVIGCAYLNSLQRQLADSHSQVDLLPTPPVFHRDFASCLLQFALMSQVAESDVVMLTEARFQIAGTDLDWTLLLIPDAASIGALLHAASG